MRKKLLLALLAVSLMCGSTGCGESESAVGEATGGDSVDLSGISGGGDSVDLSGGSGGGDAVDLSGVSGDGDSAGSNQVQEDFVIVNVPTISYDDFGNGFYDEYVVDYEPLLERTYDEDGLLTGARLYYEDMTDPRDARIALNYEKNGGMVTACEISADMYAWYLCGQSVLNMSGDDARETDYDQQRNMPYRLVFNEPIEANPDVMKEALVTEIDETVAELNEAILPPTLALDFYKAFRAMYLTAFGGTEQEGTDEPISYDEDGLLNGVRLGYETETGEAIESWLTVQYERQDGQVTACEINADLYAFFVYEFGFDEESAKERNEELLGQMPARIVFDEPLDPEPNMVADWTVMNLERLVDDGLPAEAFEGIMEIYFRYYASGAQATAGQVDIGGSIENRFRERMNGDDLAVNYFGGGNLVGEMKIDNRPVWTADMPVSQDEIVCQIETEQDSAGNLTLVRVYNDYAIYDYVFTYDSAGRMVRYDYYEYPKGQSREAVGVQWYTVYDYDGEGRLTKKETLGTQANRVDSATEYYYDDMGRVAARIDTIQYFGNDFMTVQQTYDSVAQSYEYDDTGKVALVSVTVDWAQTPVHTEPPAPTTVRYWPAR